MNEKEAQSVEQVVEKLSEFPKSVNWEITGVAYGYGKVLLFCKTPSGRPVQFMEKVNELHGKPNYRP